MTIFRRSLRALLLLVTFASAARTGSAQSPLLRTRLSALRDSLAADSTGTGFAVPAEPRSPEERLRAGFILLGRGSRDTTAAPLAAALDQFYEVTVRAPRWPLGWLGLGLTKLRLDDLGVLEIRSVHQPAGSGWRGGALSGFAEALRRDPDLGEAVAGVVEVLRRDPAGATAEEAERLLRSYTVGRRMDAAAALALARASIARDSLTQGEDFLRKYLAAGGDSALADWERATIRFALHDPAGGTAHYYAALAGGTEVQQLVRENLALIATPEELAGFDSCPPGGRVDWVHRFWAKREIADGRLAGSRLPEHFRRVRYALSHFRARARYEIIQFERAFRDAPKGLDDRAVIYIRQGEPDARASFHGGPATLPNESWSYFRPTGQLDFHFMGLNGGAYRLVTYLGAIDPDIEGLYESRANLGTVYLRIANIAALQHGREHVGIYDSPLLGPEWVHREKTRTNAMVHIGTTTDADPIDLERTWEPIVQAYGTVDPTTDSTGVLVVVSLPVPRDIDTLSVPGGIGYIVRLRATAADDSGRVALDSDVVRHLRTPRPLTRNESLTLIEHYPLGPGDQRLRLIVADSTEARGAVRIVPDLPVVRLRGDSLAVSDVIAGRVGSTVTWRRPDGHVVELQPNNAWRPEDQMSIAFDVGGLHPGGSYQVQIGIADLGADTTRPPNAAISFENQATGPREFISQQLGLRALKPGKYLLTATVTAGNRSIRRERRITIVGG